MDSSLDIWDSSPHERELEDLVLAWYEGDSEVPLYEFLGVEKNVYAMYVTGKISAEQLLNSRNNG